MPVGAANDSMGAGAPRRFALGVLLVHGIGSQQSGETLMRWTDTLLHVIRSATKDAVQVSVVEARTRGTGRNERAEAIVRFGHEGQSEDWLVAESWWAQSFIAPSYGDLVSWSVRALPWSVALFIAERYAAAAAGATGTWERVELKVRAALQLLFLLLFTPLFLATLAVVLLLGWLPVPQLRGLMLSAQSLLTASVGDSLAFVESPIRAGLIRTRILTAFRHLDARCERTVVVAHSQGAAAVLDALHGIADPASVKWSSDGTPIAPFGARAAPDVRRAPHALVTFGAGINQLASLKLLSSDVLPESTRNPALLGIGALLVACGSLVRLAVLVRSGTTLAAIAKGLGMLSGAVVLFAVFAQGGMWLSDVVAARMSRSAKPGKQPEEGRQKLREKLAIGWMVVTLLPLLVGLFVIARRSRLPMGPLYVLLFALFVLVVAILQSLSPQALNSARWLVARPAGVATWIDLHASADPVSNGKTRTGNPGEVEPREIWNRGSVFADHTAYWANLDGFVLRVARVCAETAQSPWQGALTGVTPSVDERAKWRVGFLTPIRWAMIATWLAALVVLWSRYGGRMPLPIDPPTWLPDIGRTFMRALSLLTLLAVAGSLCNRLVLWPWRRWETSEQRQVLRGEVPASAPLFQLGFMLFVVLALLVAAVQLASGWQPRMSWDDAGDLVVVLSGWSIMPAWLLVWLRPAPPWNGDPMVRSAYVETRRTRAFLASYVGFWLLMTGATATAVESLHRAYLEPFRRLAREFALPLAHGRVIAAESESVDDKLLRSWTLRLPATEAESLRKRCQGPAAIVRSGRLVALLADAGRRKEYGLEGAQAARGCYISRSSEVGTVTRSESELILEGGLLQLRRETGVVKAN